METTAADTGEQPIIRPPRSPWWWASRLALGLAALIVLYVGVTFVQVWRASTHDNARPSDAIVVLGAAQYDGRPSPVLQARLDRAFDLYVYDSSDDGQTNYDRVLAVPAAPVAGDATPIAGDATPVPSAKDGSVAVADLAAGEWADVKVQLAGERAGQTAGFYLKAIEIAPDLSQFRVYFTPIARVNASYNGCTASGRARTT